MNYGTFTFAAKCSVRILEARLYFLQRCKMTNLQLNT